MWFCWPPTYYGKFHFYFLKASLFFWENNQWMGNLARIRWRRPILSFKICRAQFEFWQLNSKFLLVVALWLVASCLCCALCVCEVVVNATLIFLFVIFSFYFYRSYSIINTILTTFKHWELSDYTDFSPGQTIWNPQNGSKCESNHNQQTPRRWRQRFSQQVRRFYTWIVKKLTFRPSLDPPAPPLSRSQRGYRTS